MKSKIALSLAVIAGLCAQAAPVMAKPSKAQQDQKKAMAQIPTCAKPLGTITIVNGDDPRGWRQYNLAPPEKLLKVIVQKSGCFKLVDRGAGMNAAMAERDLAAGGELQRGSNVGKGQIKTADYVLVAEVAAQDSDAGGSAVAGAVGGLVGGNAGALIGGIKTKKLEAQTVLSITDTRTSEIVAVEEGYASKTDIGWGAGGGMIGTTGFGGLVGGGYEDTDIGKIVTQSFIVSYSKLVEQLGGVSGQPAADAPMRAFRVQTATTLRKGPDPKAPILRALPVGLMVYPTGNKEGMYWEVADENDNVGWVKNDSLAPAN